MEERLSVPSVSGSCWLQRPAWRRRVPPRRLRRNRDGQTATQTHSPSSLWDGSSGTALECPQHSSFLRASQKPWGMKPAGGAPRAKATCWLCRSPGRARKRNSRAKPGPIPLRSCTTLYAPQRPEAQTSARALAFPLPSFQTQPGFRTLQL